ncbi:MAG: amino acid ABC transporter permease [Lachnospiraceae bacterium]|nr:amino acid ABC transporter permease [Lachnospiraceae bacterium]
MANLFDVKLVFTQIPALLTYLPVTLELTIMAMIIGLVLGLIIALIRVAKIPVLNRLCILYVTVIRGTPVLVQLYITYFGIPIALKYFNYYNGTDYNINNIPGIVFAMVALGLNQAAFNSETIRSAILAIDKGQIEAANALGMSSSQILRRILIPEAGAVALLPLGNSIISLVKGTSLAFSCSVVELTAAGKILAGRNYRYFEAYCSLAIIYCAITVILEQVMKLIEKKISIPEEPQNEPGGNKSFVQKIWKKRSA